MASLQSQIAEYVSAHPKATTREIGEKFGCQAAYVRTAAQRLGFEVAKPVREPKPVRPPAPEPNPAAARQRLHPGNIARKKESRAFDPAEGKPVAVAPTRFECRGIPLVDLRPGDCKWAVNDAGVGEVHLFCGNPAIGSYCRDHFVRSLGRGTETERSAHRSLERAAA